MQSSQKVIVWVIVAVIVIAVVGGIVYVLNRSPSSAPSTINTTTTTTAAADVTLQDVQNATYTINGSPEKLTDGSFQGNGISAFISSYASGDVNGDGKLDAAVVVTYTKTGSSVQTDTLQLVSNQNGQPQASLVSIPSESGELLATGFSVTGIDASGTISIQLDFTDGTQQTRQYKYQNGQLVQTSSNPPVTATSGWKTYTDSQSGFSFQYPVSLNSQFTHIGKVTAFSDNTDIDTQGCYIPPVSQESSWPYEPTLITINGMTFCQSNDLSPGAGTLGGNYYYTTIHNGIHYTLSYQIGTPNGCGAYQNDPNVNAPDNEKYRECIADGQNFNAIVLQPLQQSAATLTFTK